MWKAVRYDLWEMAWLALAVGGLSVLSLALAAIV
jgi:hypothetical protein